MVFGGRLAAALFKPHNILLVVINSVLIYHLIGKFHGPLKHGNTGSTSCNASPDYNSSPMAYRDYTLEDLIIYDGVQNERILVAVDMRVYDVTAARSNYGPGGSYSALAGRDASRSLALNDLYRYPKGELQEYDLLMDLTPKQRDLLNSWVDYFNRKYDVVGTLLPYHLPENGSDGEPGFQRGGGFLPEDD